jgi:DNA-binding MarR family transcriptional regulator
MTAEGFRSSTYLLQKLAKHTLDAVETSVQQLQLTARQVLMLQAIADDPEISQAEIAMRIGLDPTVLGRSLDELETSGYLRRKRAEADRRRHHLMLTPAGKRLLGQATRQFQVAEARTLETLSQSEQQQLNTLLLKASGY